MINDNVIKKEILAEVYVENVVRIRQLLKEGHVKICQEQLEQLEAQMFSTLAHAEMYDVDIAAVGRVLM
jgi:arginine/lysine/ornithine decarboxylase